MLSKSLKEIYMYVLKVGCKIELDEVFEDKGTVYKFKVYKTGKHHNMSGVIRLCDNPLSIYNTVGLDNVEYGSTESVFDVIQRMRDPLNRKF